MHAIDTNVIVRYLTGDDPRQAAKARALVGHAPVFVPRTVLLEVEWVLRAVYQLPVARVLAALRGFAGLPGVTIEDAGLAARALRWAEAGMDFADALHLARAADCQGLLTFDKRFIGAASGSGGVTVAAP